MACKKCEERRAKVKAAGAKILQRLTRREQYAVSHSPETKKNDPKSPKRK